MNGNSSKHSEMVPPWKRFPNLPAGDIGWRMGEGEHYLNKWWEWAKALNVSSRQNYLVRNSPIPKDWLLWAAEVYIYDCDFDDESEAEDNAYGLLLTLSEIE